METAVEQETCAYAAGEEVVLRLVGVEVLDTHDGATIREMDLPSWTIGEIGVVTREAAGLRYAVFFRRGDALCVCVVGAEVIEGTA